MVTDPETESEGDGGRTVTVPGSVSECIGGSTVRVFGGGIGTTESFEERRLLGKAEDGVSRDKGLDVCRGGGGKTVTVAGPVLDILEVEELE